MEECTDTMHAGGGNAAFAISDTKSAPVSAGTSASTSPCTQSVSNEPTSQPLSSPKGLRCTRPPQALLDLLHVPSEMIEDDPEDGRFMYLHPPQTSQWADILQLQYQLDVYQLLSQRKLIRTTAWEEETLGVAFCHRCIHSDTCPFQITHSRTSLRTKVDIDGERNPPPNILGHHTCQPGCEWFGSTTSNQLNSSVTEPLPPLSALLDEIPSDNTPKSTKSHNHVLTEVLFSSIFWAFFFPMDTTVTTHKRRFKVSVPTVRDMNNRLDGFCSKLGLQMETNSQRWVDEVKVYRRTLAKVAARYGLNAEESLCFARWKMLSAKKKKLPPSQFSFFALAPLYMAVAAAGVAAGVVCYWWAIGPANVVLGVLLGREKHIMKRILREGTKKNGYISQRYEMDWSAVDPLSGADGNSLPRQYAVTHFEGQDEIDVTRMYPKSLSGETRRNETNEQMFGDKTSLELLFLPGHPLSGSPQLLIEQDIACNTSGSDRVLYVVGGLLWTCFSNFWVTLWLFGSSGDSSSATILVASGLVTVAMFTLSWLVMEHKHDRINRDIAKHQTIKTLIS